MVLYLVWTCVLLAYAMSRIAEWRIHSKNYAALKQLGAEELIPRLMRRYYVVPYLAIALATAEHALAQQPVWREMLQGGALLALAGFALRAWAIQSLGPAWSMRCLALTGLRPTNRGPYGFLDNPEYLSRLIEVSGICLMLGARLTTLVYLVVMVFLNRRIATVERRQLLEVACLPRALY